MSSNTQSISFVHTKKTPPKSGSDGTIIYYRSASHMQLQVFLHLVLHLVRLTLLSTKTPTLPMENHVTVETTPETIPETTGKPVAPTLKTPLHTISKSVITTTRTDVIPRNSAVDYTSVSRVDRMEPRLYPCPSQYGAALSGLYPTFSNT